MKFLLPYYINSFPNANLNWLGIRPMGEIRQREEERSVLTRYRRTHFFKRGISSENHAEESLRVRKREKS